MQLISKFSKRFRFLLCVIDIYSKYASIILLKDKEWIIITNAFQQFLNESKRKPNKIWVDKGSEFYNKSIKSFFQNKDIWTYSTNNEGESFVAERFIRTLKNEICKCMTWATKNICIDKLDDMVDKCNNTYRSTIRMKPVRVKSNTYIDSNTYNRHPKFKIGGIVTISKYINISEKGYTLNWSEEVFAINKVKNNATWTCVINDLNLEEIVGLFYEKKLQKSKS